MKRFLSLLLTLIIIASSLTSCFDFWGPDPLSEEIYAELDSIPEFDGKTPYVRINGNKPFIEEASITTESFEEYYELDSLGRCTKAFACLGEDLMPTGPRGDISYIYPSGWMNKQYDIVEGNSLYNRCHLIGFQLSGENANKKNLITGTRFMNVKGMLPFENMVADYIKETENHVMYSVTPIFEGNNLVASGVLMEAVSVEDNGKGIEFCVYVYNSQPGIVIDYQNGDSRLATDEEFPDISDTEDEKNDTDATVNYIINRDTKKFHLPTCRYALDMSESNRAESTSTRDELIFNGYSPCKFCNP